MTDVTLTVPAEYAEDFRAAIVEEIAFEAEAVRQDRRRTEEMAERRDTARQLVNASDLESSMDMLAREARLLGQVGHKGTEPIQVRTDDHEILAGAFEAMARRGAARLSDELGATPITDGKGLRELAERVLWAAERASECHAAYWRGREAVA